MNNESRAQDLRRNRLREWLAERGGSKACCVAAGQGKNVETRISNVLHGESFGSRGARAMERNLKMPDGYLDRTESAKAVETVAPQLESGLSAQAQDLGKLLDMLPDLIARSEAYAQCSKIIIDSLRSKT
jgi:hypothetical protein